MTMMNGNNRIIVLTVDELDDIIVSAIQRAKGNERVTMQPRRQAYGIAGIASIFGCSQRTAERIKASGKIDGAISQQGRTIVVDVDKALDLYSINL